MKFFDNMSKVTNDLVSGYITGEILLLGIISIVSICFLSLLIIHVFSKDIIAKRKLKKINKILSEEKYDTALKTLISKKLRLMPYHFFENYQNGLNTMTFQDCVPYYESSKNFGKRLFVVLSGITCLLVSIAALILTESNIISYLSNALFIPVAGLVFAFILEAVYIYLKAIAYKKLRLTFDCFIKIIRPKEAAYKNVAGIKKSVIDLKNENHVSQPLLSNEEKENEELFEKLMNRIQEVKLNSDLKKMKDLANDLALSRDNYPLGSPKKESLTDALTDLLNMISQTA